MAVIYPPQSSIRVYNIPLWDTELEIIDVHFQQCFIWFWATIEFEMIFSGCVCVYLTGNGGGIV